MAIITNPTGGQVRMDSGGDGHYGASRRKTKKGQTIRYAHRGTDFSGTPGQPVKAPIGGILVREARPYSTGPYSGCLIVGKKGTCKMFYLKLNRDLIGKLIAQGDVIGVMQDIGQKWKSVTAHIHVQFPQFNPEVLLDNTDLKKVNSDKEDSL